MAVSSLIAIGTSHGLVLVFGKLLSTGVRAKIVKILRYRKVPKFLDTKKLCCNRPKNQTKRPNLRVFCQKDANGIANSEDPDQTAPRGAV